MRVAITIYYDDGTFSVESTEFDADTAEQLRQLASSTAVPDGSIADVIRHLIWSAADGVRRSGSWERGWVETCFGEWGGS